MLLGLKHRQNQPSLHPVQARRIFDPPALHRTVRQVHCHLAILRSLAITPRQARLRPPVHQRKARQWVSPVKIDKRSPSAHIRYARNSVQQGQHHIAQSMNTLISQPKGRPADNEEDEQETVDDLSGSNPTKRTLSPRRQF